MGLQRQEVLKTWHGFLPKFRMVICQTSPGSLSQSLRDYKSASQQGLGHPDAVKAAFVDEADVP